jgi:hypothetical protein
MRGEQRCAGTGMRESKRENVVRHTYRHGITRTYIYACLAETCRPLLGNTLPANVGHRYKCLRSGGSTKEAAQLHDILMLRNI